MCNDGDFNRYLEILGEGGFLKNVRTQDVVWRGTIPAAGFAAPNAPIALTLALGDRTAPSGPLDAAGTMNAASKAIITHVGAVVDYTATLTIAELQGLQRLLGACSVDLRQNTNPLSTLNLGAIASSQGTRLNDGSAAPASVMPFGPIHLIDIPGKPIVEPTETVTADVAGAAPVVAAPHVLAVITRMVVGDLGED